MEIAPDPSWAPGDGSIDILANLADTETLPGFEDALPPDEGSRVSLGALSATRLHTPFQSLAELSATKTIGRSGLYLHEPYLTLNDDVDLAKALVTISSDLYAEVDCRAEPPEAIEAHIHRYFVTWSFLMVRSAPGLRDRKELFRQADLIAVAAFAGEGFVVWRAPDIAPEGMVHFCTI
ncbi:hypothetical protein ASE91_17890 [Sphingomonas sp. Leaf62]|nr:hypothetical protein ASE91_17890 [Sphingomonas sp. Leaf62]